MRRVFGFPSGKIPVPVLRGGRESGSGPAAPGSGMEQRMHQAAECNSKDGREEKKSQNFSDPE